MNNFVPDKARDKRNYKTPKTSGPVKPPTPHPYIRLYHGFLTDPKPDAIVSYILINSNIQIKPDPLEIQLRKNKVNCQVGVFMTQKEGNRNLLILLKTPGKIGEVGAKIRKVIEAMHSDS